MKALTIISIVIQTIFTTIFLLSCKEDKLSLPTLGPTIVNSITHSYADCSGEMVNEGSAMITTYGFCWGTNENPTILDFPTITVDDRLTNNGIFTCRIFGLSSNTTYFLRTYAKNAVGTVYGEQIQFTTLVYNIGQAGSLNDVEGNIYSTIEIGSQIWMTENLRTTKYNDGTAIPNVTDVTIWNALNTDAYCDYDNKVANSATYGRLYNWFASTKKVCPTGWHVPNVSEQEILRDFLGYNGGKLKETGTLHWSDPNNDATNETGFTALPGGFRSVDGTFSNLGFEGFWWSSSETCDFCGNEQPNSARTLGLYYNSGSMTDSETWKKMGISVRCIKD